MPEDSRGITACCRVAPGCHNAVAMSDLLQQRFPDIPWAAFLLLHQDLPREGPGSDEATSRAIRQLPPLPPAPVVYDLGCGPGRQTLVLARTLRSSIIALDLVQQFLDTLSRRAAEQGLSDLVVPRCADMAQLEAEPGSIDLIWTEGSIYFVGFARALELWRPLLAPGGCVVASHATWLTDDPPDDARQIFEQELPDMTDVEGNRRLAAGAGYATIDSFVLPPSAWWDEYYTPMLQRIELLRPLAAGEAGGLPGSAGRARETNTAGDAKLAAVLTEAEAEIDLFRRCGSSYSYVFYVMQKAP